MGVVWTFFSRLSFLFSYSLSLGDGPIQLQYCLKGPLSPKQPTKKKKRREKKNAQTSPPAPTASAVGPCPAIIQISRMPRHQKFTQHHRTTRPPQGGVEVINKTHEFIHISLCCTFSLPLLEIEIKKRGHRYRFQDI